MQLGKSIRGVRGGPTRVVDVADLGNSIRVSPLAYRLVWPGCDNAVTAVAGFSGLGSLRSLDGLADTADLRRLGANL
jgi:hypothetical protein